ncbi:hypothetical protein JCM16303_004808 [Sporobolomyces ruberrimus]
MAPVDPGATILWAKNPAYSTALVSRISALSKSEAESLFSSNKSRSAEWKLAKQASLERVTKEVFTAGGDHAREKKQLDSTCRRVAQLFKQYEDSLGLLRQDPYNVAETLDYLRRTYPYWNDLRALLRDHPEASTWDEVEDQARDDEAESDEHGDPMQDLNVSIRGHVISEQVPGETEGVVFELSSGGDAVQIKHPQLVTISTRPESQTLRSINTGEPLFSLETPLLPKSPGDSTQEDDGGAEEERAMKPSEQRTITLHAGLIAATRIDPSAVQTSPLFSQAFSILIDAPTFPAPHFDPSSLTPPTPSVRAADQHSSSYSGILNSPTLQRALLSPLLSPQRRAASQGSDMSVPPLSLGLSRTSRASFSADNRSLRPNASHQQSGLMALLPALAPSAHSSGQSSTNVASSPSVSAVPQTPPTHASDPHSLASNLTASISASAKKTAEDILSLRRNHDAFVRRAKAEMEVLEARIESVRSGANGGGVVGGGGVVRGFGLPLVIKKDVSAGGDQSESRSRERGRSAGRGGGERSPLASKDADRKESPSTRARRDRDEDVSSKLREADQREEDERGRSRSRQRRREDPRSISRTKKIAEATEAAAKGAKDREQRGDSSREREDGTDDQIFPATTADGDDDGEEDEGGEETRGSRSKSTLRASTVPTIGGTTPSFIPSSSTQGLVAIPETEELSIPPSETSRATSPSAQNFQTRQRTATNDSEREEDAPFEMDEDVDIDFLELSSSRPIFQQQPPDFGTYEASDPLRSPTSTSTYRPGSLQRASSLSASYAALLSSTSDHQSASSIDNPSNTPSTVQREHPMATTPIEDVNVREAGSQGPPNPRDVRQGEQKIRDVLAIDVPSHRRALPRKVQRDGGSRNADDSVRDDPDEGLDAVQPLASSPNKFQVGSLPIPLAHRPSTRAMSSWRPDPEREWALEREKRSGGGTGRPPIEGSSRIPDPVDPRPSVGGQSTTPRAGETAPATVPLEIGGGGATPNQGSNRPPGGSSLAQSLRNAPAGSFSSRLGQEQGTAGSTSEQLHLPGGVEESEEPGEGEDEDDDGGVFLPPHLVADRRDFLTQPLQVRNTQPAASPKVSDASSVLTASTSDTSRVVEQSNVGFTQLRTAHSPAARPDETALDLPSTKNGDWRAFGRVECGIVLWENGTLADKKNLKEQASREEWALSGTLWFTKRSEVLFVVDQSIAPRPIVKESKPAPTGRRLSISRLRSSSPGNSRSPGTEHRAASEEPTKGTDEHAGLFSKILDAVKPGRKERRRSSSGSDGHSLSRSRSRTGSQADTPYPSVETGHNLPADELVHETSQLKFEEPSSAMAAASPFPLYKGCTVTGLYIVSPSHIQSLRFYPQKPASATESSSFSFFSFSKTNEPLSSPASSPTVSSTTMMPPVVELDVIDPAHLGSVDEGKKREVTVGFSFVEVLCATEADDFYRILQTSLEAPDEVPIHRTVSRSLDTGGAQKRKSLGTKA